MHYSLIYFVPGILLLLVATYQAPSVENRWKILAGAWLLFDGATVVMDPALSACLGMLFFGAALGTIPVRARETPQAWWTAIALAFLIAWYLLMASLPLYVPTQIRLDVLPKVTWYCLVLLGWYWVARSKNDLEPILVRRKASAIAGMALVLSTLVALTLGRHSLVESANILVMAAVAFGLAIDEPVWIWLGSLGLAAMGLVLMPRALSHGLVQLLFALSLLVASIHNSYRFSPSLREPRT